ncbi:hypothetical protein LX64_04801 [Chitinophaga skermanii]|uniref:Uncharacterized protein n=1 Tax=Chitinophaga skermanii TaxID=331697 RepID=A0A327Q264_9BACT|nr:hypothetical protein LX64_04801 [Chitinophaga skermanii]
MQKKFCCTRLGIRHEVSREIGMNFRVVKYDAEVRFDKTNLFRFFVTPGYMTEERNVKHLNIKFCPFCGTNLYEFYKADEFINEDPGYF